MEKYSMLIEQSTCEVCLSTDLHLFKYFLQCKQLRDIVQKDYITVCVYCKKRAINTQLFLENVISVQSILKLSTVDAQNESLKKLNFKLGNSSVQYLDLELDKNDFGNYLVLSSQNVHNEIVKDEIQEDFGVNVDCLLVDYESVPLEHDIKEEINKEEFEEDKEIIKVLHSFNVKSKIKRKKCIDKEDEGNAIVQSFYLTKRQCMDERLKMAADKLYLDSVFKCVSCLKGYAHKETYQAHMLLHNPVSGDHKCDICSQRCTTQKRMAAHRRIHFKRYKCTECDLVRSCRVTITEHYASVHSRDLNHTCVHCSKVYSKKSLLRKHVWYKHRTKEKVICHFCHKSYSTKQTLSNHLNMKHLDISMPPKRKDHICSECGKGFLNQSCLKAHALVHSEKKDFYCVECDRAFKSETSLKHHLRTTMLHVQRKELPLPCGHCNVRFSTRRSLEQHINFKHLNIKPFICKLCEKTYLSESSLKSHMKLIHEGYKKPMKFSCTFCDRKFNNNSILKSHTRIHTGSRPYKCVKCDATFTQSGIRNTHYKLVHLKLQRNGQPKAVAKNTNTTA